MSNKVQNTQDELQHLEHYNKMLREHRDITKMVTAEVQVDLQKHISTLNDYAKSLKAIQVEMGLSINNIYKSAQEVRRATSGVQEILSFCQAVMKLEATLNNPDVQKALNMVNRNG